MPLSVALCPVRVRAYNGMQKGSAEFCTALSPRATIPRWYLDDGMLHSTNCIFGFPSTLLIIDHHRTV